MRRVKCFVFAIILTAMICLPVSVAELKNNRASAADYVATVDFSNGATSGTNLELVVATWNDAITQSSNKGGSNCRYVPGGEYAYFKASDSAVPATQANMFVEVTYFDEGTGAFAVQYNGKTADYQNAQISRTGSNTWCTTSVILTDAKFSNAQNNAADFRISGEVYIKSVKISFDSVNLNSTDLGKRTGGSSYSDFSNKTVAGYQSWFGTGGQNSYWSHWGRTNTWPSKNNHTIDIYPDVSEYDDSIMAQTGFAKLGSGDNAKLFASQTDNAIDTHFKWMQETGLDGAALQRFSATISGRSILGTPENHLYSKVARAAEKYDRIFYIMYDMSGAVEPNYVDDMKFDWIYNVEQGTEILNSDSYATVNGKPVVCIWGFGVPERVATASYYQELVSFFKSRDCYLILGTNDNWRNQSQYINIFKQADMISPWYVGRFGDTNGINNFYANNLEPDLQYCRQNGLDYYPVVFSGFSWATWENGRPNMTPRNRGNFFWHQAYKLKQLGINQMYIAMFDEYDEGTAIMKNATDYFDIPTDQYFVTASADGWWLSSDFQLRTVGNAIKMLKGTRETTATNPTVDSEGPLLYRNSFESRYADCIDTQYSGNYPIDPCFKNPAQVVATNVSGTSVAIDAMSSKTGNYSAKVTGTSNGAGAVFDYKFSESNVKIASGTKLSFDKFTSNEQGKYVTVDVVCTDGTRATATVSAAAATTARGTVNNWTNHEILIGTGNMVGKTVATINFRYEGTASGAFTAYFDNVKLETAEVTANPVDLYVSAVQPSNSSLNNNDASKFYCTVRNNSSYPTVSNVKVEFYVDNRQFDTVNITEEVPAGGIKIVSTNLDKAVFFGSHTVRAVVNSDNSVEDTDRTNDALKQRFTVTDN